MKGSQVMGTTFLMALSSYKARTRSLGVSWSSMGGNHFVLAVTLPWFTDTQETQGSAGCWYDKDPKPSCLRVQTSIAHLTHQHNISRHRKCEHPDVNLLTASDWSLFAMSPFDSVSTWCCLHIYGIGDRVQPKPRAGCVHSFQAVESRAGWRIIITKRARLATPEMLQMLGDSSRVT